MPKTFHVTAPDGHVLEITGPDDATEEQALSQAQALYKPQQDPNAAIKAQQAAKFPTAAEGGNPEVPWYMGLLNRGNPSSPVTQALEKLPAVLANTTGEQVQTGMEDPAYKLFTLATPGGPASKGMGLIEAAQKSPIANAGRSVLDKIRGMRGTQAGAIEKALAPKTLETKAVTQDVAPKLAEAGESPVYTQSVFDQMQLKRLDMAKNQLRYAEEAIPEGTTLARKSLLDQIDSAISKYTIPGQPVPATKTADIQTLLEGNSSMIPRTVTGHPDAVGALKAARAEIQKLPEQVPFEDILKYRRQLDKAISESNGWSDTASAADKAVMQARKTVANIIRGDLGQVSPELADANKVYSRASDVAEVIRRRQLGEVGKPGQLGKVVKRAIGVGATAAGGGAAVYEMERLLGH